MLFQFGYSPMAAQEMLKYSEREEFYEAARAIKEQLILYLVMYKKTGTFPMIEIYSYNREDYKRGIENLCKIYEPYLNKYQYGEFIDNKEALNAI